jgi:hypothetical protein
MRILLSSLEQFEAFTGQREIFIGVGHLAVRTTKIALLEALNIGEGPEYILRFKYFAGDCLLILEADCLQSKVTEN